MAEPGPLVREAVLEELLAGEVLEVWVLHPTLADLLVGQAEDVLEQQQAQHEAGFDGRPAGLAIERRDLLIQPVPVDLAGQLRQLVLEVDDLVEPRAEQVNRVRRHILLRPHRFLLSVVIERPSESRTVKERNPQNQNASFVAFIPPKLAIPKRTSAAKTILLQRLGRCSRSTT